MAALVMLALVLCLPQAVQAQTPEMPPPNFRIPPFDLPDVEEPADLDEIEPDEPAVTAAEATRVIVDTDMGVDDAVALVWLLAQRRYPVEVDGIVAVAGNTTVEQAASNILTVTTWFDEPAPPIVVGAAQPLSVTRSRQGLLIHGPDGLWGLNSQNAPDISGLPTDANGFYCNNIGLDDQPQPLIIALGPLTNLANAINFCPDRWAGVRIVSLGGAKFGGNQTPVTEYNYWQDPEAAALLADLQQARDYTLEIVPLDAFSQFVVRERDIARLERLGVRAMRNLYPALDTYLDFLAANFQPLIIPDPAAMIYALDPTLGIAQPALTKVTKSGPGIPEYLRGQTVMALTFVEDIQLRADDAELSVLAERALFDQDFDLPAALFAILNREPDNTIVVTDIYALRMVRIFLRGVTAPPGSRDQGTNDNDSAVSGDNVVDPHELFIPLVEGTAPTDD